MAFSLPKVSIVVSTYNNKKVLEKVLDAMLILDYPNDYEIIVVDDGSHDGTIDLLHEKFDNQKRIRVLGQGKNKGVCKARNMGIHAAKYPIIVNMDHDCIPKKEWLKELVSAFEDPQLGVASSFGSFGGTSTAFRAELLQKAGGYDEKYRYYREDTDLTFTIMDLGYKYKVVKANYYHDHKEVAPKGFWSWANYILTRLQYHQNDVLLYKKHPKLAGKFLEVKLGFIVNPAADFKAVTNLWEGSVKKLKLCSPRGIVLLENKSPLHALVIIFLATGYVFAVKFSRVLGSIKFFKLLI